LLAAHGLLDHKTDYRAAGQASTPLLVKPLHLLRREKN